MILNVPRAGGVPGRPKESPDEAYAGRVYDSDMPE